MLILWAGSLDVALDAAFAFRFLRSACLLSAYGIFCLYFGLFGSSLFSWLWVVLVSTVGQFDGSGVLLHWC